MIEGTFARKLIKNWALPNRSDERIQLTLRLSFVDYARLHALKEVYPQRSVNDIIGDVIRSGLDEIVDALPVYTFTLDDVGHECGPEDVGSSVGERVTFEAKFREILEMKSTSDGEKDKKTVRLVEGDQVA